MKQLYDGIKLIIILGCHGISIIFTILFLYASFMVGIPHIECYLYGKQYIASTSNEFIVLSLGLYALISVFITGCLTWYAYKDEEIVE